MLTINHTICPECSIGCGLNVISKDGIIVGINPFKNNEINEGKNCKNCTEYINNISTMENKTFDYDNVINELKNKMESTDSEKITILTSGNTDNNDLDNLIKFADDKGVNLVSYEYEFTKINPELIASYDEVEKADQIITIGDIYRKNSLIGRRIIHAKENDAKTINIYTETNLTGFNSDEFKQIESFDELNQVLDSIDFTENTIIIINEISSTQNYVDLIKLIEDKNIKVLPLLQHPNSYSILEKTESLSKEELASKIEDSELIILVNENPLEYLDDSILEGKTIISLTQNGVELGLTVPVKVWCQKETSFTNSEGLTQNYPDAINDEENTLKTVSEVLDLI
ncbi:hypothetical protein [Methanosphaera sp.]|uniref:hypothetical protein n=1 Tax=Methanosphaera sp. TaxID=2666342 RepID=UPI002E78E701|nr:hypothetical protein [Methanosphaera sp.]MEE1118280.1 hypothetical protein [Methanosphaera sp.]